MSDAGGVGGVGGADSSAAADTGNNDSGVSASAGVSEGVTSPSDVSAYDDSIADSSAASSAAAAAAEAASHSKGLSAPTTGSQLEASATSAESIANTNTTAESLATDTAIEGISVSVTGYEGKVGPAEVTVGAVSFEAVPPSLKVDTEAGMAEASLGRIAVDVTAINAQLDAKWEPASGRVQGIVGTVNAHAEAGFNAHLGDRIAEGKIAAGAESMAAEATLEAEVSITGKTVADTLGSAYNAVVDPVVDVIAGYDVPGVPAAPESWDHGINLGGHATLGWGASIKGSAGGGYSPGNGGKFGVSGKIGLGPTVGAGVTIGLQ